MELIKKSLGKWITNVLVFVVGILCIISGATYGSSSSIDSMNAISMILGITLIVVSSISFFASLILLFITKKSLMSSSVVSGLLLSVGIWFVTTKTVGTLISLTLSFIPIVMIVLGAILLADCLYGFFFFFRYKEVKQKIAPTIVMTLVALFAIIFGSLCLVTKDGSPIIGYNVQLIILGVILMLEAVLQILSTFVDVTAIKALNSL